MSTSFPTFCLKISDPLWFTSSEQKDDEMEVCWLESMYQSWFKDVIEKDKDAPYIGKKPDSETINDSELDGEWEASGEEEEEDVNNGYQDSLEEQNNNLQTGMDTNDDDVDDNSWIL